MQLATKFVNWMRKSTQNNLKPRHPVWMRIICLLLMFTFIPVFQFDAGAALATRYIWLISKPAIKVSYTNAVYVLNTETNSGVKMTLQGEYYVADSYIPVVTQYNNETVPTLDLWEGTKFAYTGEARPYPGDDKVTIDDNVTYYAGNYSGGNQCDVATRPDQLERFSDGKHGPIAVKPLSRFSSGTTTYYIKPRVHKNEIAKGDNRKMLTNVTMFKFKSTKPLPGYYDPPEPEVHAKLDIRADDIRENYKEFDVRGKASTEVVFDPSASTSKLGWKNYGMDGNSALSDWTLRDSWNGKPSRQRYTVTYTKKNIGFTGKPGTIRDTISGEVVVSDGTVSDRAKASAKVNLTFYNDEPIASIGSVKSQNLSQGGSGYDSTFYYTGVPIQITDASYDPEDRSYDEQTKEPVIQYAIQYQGQNILVTENFQTPNKIDDLFDSAAAKDGTLTVSLKNPGYYTIRAWVQDEIGATATQTKTIKVSGKPEPPTAVINGGNYTFVNYPLALSDASTDPNDDIVSWVWGDVTMEDETGAQVPAAGVTDVLRDAAYQVGSTGKPADIGGTLTFSAPGIYKVGLTVTDATKLTDQTSKTIKVIRDIPVAEIEPGPEDPKNPSESDPHYGIDPEDGKEKIFVKQNRKVTLDASKSLDPPASKINWAATEWDYANTDAMPDYDMQSVKLDRSSTSQKQVLLAKNVGEFKVMLTLHNEYSDKLPETDPDLVARTKTVIVKVVPDEPPVSTIQVDNVNPNFHDNPTAVDVKVVATGKSLDNDFIDYYNWRLYRDNNDDGQYAESELLTKKDKTKTAEVSIPVRFETGNTSMFLGQVEAFERFGQETIQEFITGEDIRTSESEMEFEVNWRPCISYTMREFAYVDDTLTITPILKDENVETCSVEWVLKKKDAKGAYQAVEPTAFKPNVFADDPVWELGLHGGTVRITEDGFYRLDATITDAEGHSETFSSTEIRIYDVPRAVISDKPLYRWNNTAFQFKESRKFTLDGNASYVNDSTGEAKHQLNRSRDEWTITPLDGQSVEGIYVGKTAAGTERVASNSTTIFDMGANSFDEVLAILEPGRYRVDYRVTNTYGKKSPIKTEEIIIVEDTAPIITGAVQPSVDRGSADDGAKTVISIGDLEIRSDDMDIINENWTVELIYDKANDGFQNDAWTRVDNKFISIDRDTKQLVIANVVIPEGNLGKYQFRVYAKDIFGQETLPIVPESERKDATKIFETQVDNVKPNGTFSTRAEAKGDVVFAIGDSAVAKEVQNASLTFQNRFGAEAGMNVMDVNVEMVETSSIDLTSAFQWKRDVSPAIGSLTLDATGQNVQMFGNPSNPGKNAIWIPHADDGEQVFQFDYSIAFGDSFNGAGMMFNLAERKSGGTTYLDAYAISFNNTGPFPRGSAGSVWKLTYQVGDNHNAYFDNVQKIGDLNINLSGTLKVVVDGTKLKVSGGGLSEQTFAMDKIGTGFGFFSSHYSHGCDSIGEFSLRNFTMEVTKRKNLNDALSNVSWRDGAERFVIYVDDKIWNYMSPGMDQQNPNSYAELLSSLLDSNIHLIALGSDANKAQLEALLSQLSQSGIYNKNNPSPAAMDVAEQFIKEVLRKETKDTMYVLINDYLHYNKLYRDYNGDPQWIWKNGGNTPYIAKDDPAYAAHFKQFQDNPSILAQKWEYFHDPDYYDNSLGLAAFDQEWIAHEVNVFDKVGRYEVDYRIKDNPVPDKGDNTTGNPFHEYRYWSEDYAATHKDSNGHITNPHAVIYVHRRPMAEYDFIARKVNDIVDEVDVTNHAYDLDHSITHAQKGLNLFEWKWKFASDQTWRGEGLFDTAAAGEAWINEQLTGLRAMGMDNILIQYRVRDIDGPAEKETVPITRKGADGRWFTSEETTVRNQGVWSLPGVRWVTNKGLPPVARFDVSNTVLSLGDRVTVTDRSYSPNGDNIVKWQWTIERATGTKTTITYQLGQNGIASAEKMEELFSKYLSDWIDAQPIGTKAADNSYKVTLVVTDDKPKPMESDPFSVTIKITAENQAPTVEPPGKNPDGSGTATGDGSDGQNSLFVNNNPTVYEYDSYDANLDNPYYYYNGRLQKRGAETLDWSILLDDPDNHDKYGPGNDSAKYKVAFALDRFLKPSRAVVVDGAIGVQHINYPEKTVSREQALVSSNIAPFTVAKEVNLGWGAWRITTSVTDVPNNDSTPKTAEMVTHGTTKPLHLYIIPKLDLRDVHFTFDGVLDNQVQIPTGETVVITATTNDRSTGARIRYKDGDGKALSQEMTLVKAEGETKYWSADFVLPDNLEAEDLIGGEYFPYQVETYTNYGAKAGEETRTKLVSGAANIHILPIKLFDFTVTGITDPSVTFTDPAMARDLAYDRNNSANGKLMKLGYAFNFELYSKGMKDADDSVRIRPTFWGYNLGTGKYDLPLDMYYRNEDDQYVLATTNPDAAAASGDDFIIRTREFIGKEIGSVRQLNLTAAFRTELDRSTQKWTARYGVPGTAVFVRKGSPLTENSMYLGDVLIRFDIEAMKHGSAKYNYVGKGQWHLERTDIYGNLIRADKAKYADGDVLVMDGMNNAALDFESRPVWTKLR